MEVHLSSDTYRDLSLVAKARGVTLDQAVAFLIEQFRADAKERPPAVDTVEVWVTYEGTHVEGVYDSRTRALQVTSGPLRGRWFRSPSGAARAVVEALKPGVSPNRNGYAFWMIAGTNRALDSIRNSPSDE